MMRDGNIILTTSSSIKLVDIETIIVGKQSYTNWKPKKKQFKNEISQRCLEYYVKLGKQSQPKQMIAW